MRSIISLNKLLNIILIIFKYFEGIYLSMSIIYNLTQRANCNDSYLY